MGKHNRKRREKEAPVVQRGVLPQNHAEAKVSVVPQTPTQKEYLHAIRKSPITIATGPAGTGKTAVAIGFGLQNLLGASSAFDQIVVVRPVVEACGESLGYLPGTMDDKMSVWLAPIMDNMLIWIKQSHAEHLIAHKRVVVLPMAYARGRSLNKSFIIVDEAQNCTEQQMLMILTRMGKDSKLVINGDTRQTDRGDRNGLTDVWERLHDMEEVSKIEFSTDDIVRNPLIKKILERYAPKSPS